MDSSTIVDSQSPSDLQNSRYLGLAAFTLIVYDAILCFIEDLRLISLRSIKSPDVVYILSRILSAATVGIGLATILVPITSCLQNPLLFANKLSISILIPCNCWLFMVRIRAIYFYSRRILFLFMILWALTLTSFLTFLGFPIYNIHNADGTCTLTTHYNTRVFAILFVALLTFDTAVMVATSVSFITSYSGSPRTAKLKSMINIKDTGQFTRLFIRSGQLYYMATVGIHITMFTISLSRAIPFNLICTSLLTWTFHTIIACRVFRLLRLGSIRDSLSKTTIKEDDLVVYIKMEDTNDIQMNSLSCVEPDASFSIYQ